MMSILSPKNTFYIDGWEVDPLLNKMRNGHEEHNIEPTAMVVLERLAQSSGKTVQRSELLKAAWPSQNVTDESLTRAIVHLRQCFSDTPKSPKYIATIHKMGYRLIAKVSNGSYIKNRVLSILSDGQSLNFAKAINQIRNLTVFMLAILLVYFAFGQPVIAHLPKLDVKYITTDMGFEMSQSLSPDGLNIVYEKLVEAEGGYYDGIYNTEVYIKNIATNKVKRLPQPGGSPSHFAWSPDGRYIAYGNELKVEGEKLQHGIYTTEISSGTVNLHAITSAHSHGLTWSPDGKSIIYLDGTPENELRFLYKVNITTNQRERLAPKSNGSGELVYSHPKFSPNGDYLAVIRRDRNSGLSIDLLDTKHYYAKNIYNSGPELSGYEWKDNETLFIADGYLASKRLFEFSIDNGRIKHLPIEEEDIEYLSYSQTSKRLTFESVKQSYNIQFVNYSKDYEFLDYDYLTQSNKREIEAAESSDGIHTAIISSRDHSFDVWLKDNATEQTKKITSLQASSMSGLDWSPNNQLLLFSAVTNFQSGALYWVSAKDGGIDMFSFMQGAHIPVGWESNESILFVSDYGNKWRLWRLNAQSKKYSIAVDGPFSYGRLSPDRKTVYLVKHSFLGVWKTDINNLKPVLLPGTQSIGDNNAWVATEHGLIYFVYGEIGGYDEIYFYDFKASSSRRITRVGGVYLNRVNWANNRLYYTVRGPRNSDVALVENL